MIEVHELVKVYGQFRAVDRLSFRIEPGEIVGFLGPNGAGKTTTIRVLTGYHPATAGSCHVFGRDVLRDSLLVRSGLGYLPENVPIYPDMRVQEYLRFRARLKGVPRNEIQQRVGSAMERAGVTEMRRKLVGHVSRGYRQRVGLADALVSDPPLLILDEPTSGLDPNQRRRVRESIRELQGEHTILMSSHILADIEAVCDRIILIHEGKLRADGTLEELRRELARRQLQLELRCTEEQLGQICEGFDFEEAPAIRKGDGEGWLRLEAILQPSSDATQLMDGMAQRVRAAGFAWRSLQLNEPSLEELFFQLTEGDAA
jgi:ABC-2 type transport system ATP-binding protein